MSQTAMPPSEATPTDYRTPEQVLAEKGRGVGPAHALPLADINPLNANLFAENRWQGYFERLPGTGPFGAICQWYLSDVLRTQLLFPTHLTPTESPPETANCA